MATKSEARRAAERIHTIRQFQVTLEVCLEMGLPDDWSTDPPAGYENAKAYAVTLEEADGTESATAISVLVVPGRAGVCHGGNPEWTDVDAKGSEAAREAVARYLAGEMCT